MHLTDHIESIEGVLKVRDKKLVWPDIGSGCDGQDRDNGFNQQILPGEK